MLMLALPLIEEAAGDAVDGRASINPSPVDVIQESVRTEHFDEIIISTLPQPFLQRLHCDLSSNIAKLGLPVTTVLSHRPPERCRPTSQAWGRRPRVASQHGRLGIARGRADRPRPG
jgi:hypothetical protein